MFCLHRVLLVVKLHSALYHKEDVLLGPCPEKLRAEVGQYLLEVLRSGSVFAALSAGSFDLNSVIIQVAEIVIGRFISDECSTLMTARSRSSDGSEPPLDPKVAGSSRKQRVNVPEAERVTAFHNLSPALRSEDNIRGLSQHLQGGVWAGYLNSALEVDVIVELLRVCGSQPLSPKLWSKVVAATACITTPWTLGEVLVEKCLSSSGVQKFDKFVEKMSALLDAVLTLQDQ